MRKVGIGVIGCGVISKAYLTAMKQFSNIELRAVADMRSAAAEQRAKEFGVPGMRVDQMLKRDDVEIVVNLTVPLVVRMKGTNEDLGKKMLADSGLPIIAADDMADAARKIVAAVRGNVEIAA